MLCAALDVTGLSPDQDHRFFALLGSMPGRSLQAARADDCVLGQLVPGRGAWLPGRTADGRRVLFNGLLHNRQSLAAALGLPGATPAELCAAALDRWGDAADEHLIGHYCTVVAEPATRTLRLARSPIDAPPLHFRLHRGGVIAASLPRPLFWDDAEPRQVNRDRLARTLLVDYSDRFAGPYLGCHRVPQGTAVRVGPRDWHAVWTYDLFSRPKVRFTKLEDYVAAATALLDAGAAAAADGAQRPGVLLSSGLDSTSVAASLLCGPAGARSVHGFTHDPGDDWPELRPPPGRYVREFPALAALAARHPGLTIERLSSAGLDFRHGQRELIQAMDAGTPAVGLAWAHHALHARARELGCDVLLSPNWGNETFSSNAPWALPEWLAHGRWRQVLAAARSDHADTRPLWRKVAARAAMPWLPAPAWRALQRRIHGTAPDPFAASALNPDWAESTGLLCDRRDPPGRHTFRSRDHYWRTILAEDGQDREEYSQAAEVLYGIPLRDPAAYRPLVEFCYGIPTELFRRAGQSRWLAREMGRGRLPEAIRTRADHGLHHPDWHARLAPFTTAILAELDAAEADPDVAALIDLPRLRRLLRDLPTTAPDDWQAALPYLTALPIGMAAARFIAYAKGRNDF